MRDFNSRISGADSESSISILLWSQRLLAAGFAGDFGAAFAGGFGRGFAGGLASALIGAFAGVCAGGFAVKRRHFLSLRAETTRVPSTGY